MDTPSMKSRWGHVSESQEQLTMAVVVLLRAAWIAATLPILIACIPSSKLNSYRELLDGFCRRGKTMESTPKKFSVPQKYFCHFYVLGVVWTTFLLVATWLYAYEITSNVSGSMLYWSVAGHLTGVSHKIPLHKHHSSRREYGSGIWRCVFLLLLMEVQVLRRLFESIYVFKYSPSARMHLLGYFAGLFFYAAAPLSFCCGYIPVVFRHAANLLANFVVKGKGRMQNDEFDFLGHVFPLLYLKWYAWFGAAIFLWGWIHQHRCHAILGSLRENGKRDDGYKIPRGDWFELVSSPHYLAEIVIYLGLAVASGFSDITIWLLLGFVVANLVFSAAETHRWYAHKFDNYPGNRCAIIPFVY